MKVFIESFGTDFDVHFSENMKVNVRGTAEIRIGKYIDAIISLIDHGGYCWITLDTKETENGEEIVLLDDMEIDMKGKDELAIRKLDFEIKLRIDKISKQYFELKTRRWQHENTKRT